VRGTEEVLRLAVTGRLTPVHFVSTLGVFPAVAPPDTVFPEEHCLAEPAGLWTGYAQSKWVAERLVLEASKREVPTCIYRPGRITGHSESGACKVSDLWCAIVRCCVQLGSAPDVRGLTEMAPVDYVSRAIVHLSRQTESRGRVFHLFNPARVEFQELVEELCAFGYPVQLVSFGEWRRRLLERTTPTAIDTVGLFEQLTPGIVEQIMSYSPAFDCCNTDAGLAGTTITCPPADRTLFRVYLRHLVQVGFLEPPLRRRAAETEPSGRGWEAGQ
jgi:thioester reductase-like protein